MPTTITTIRTVAVPVADQDRSVAFFVEQLGFETRMDAELAEGFRWIEVAPPGSAPMFSFRDVDGNTYYLAESGR